MVQDCWQICARGKIKAHSRAQNLIIKSDKFGFFDDLNMAFGFLIDFSGL
jgi:hypothetical protein